MNRRHRPPAVTEPTIPGDQAVLRRLAMTHLGLQLLCLLWEKTDGEDFAVLWAATGGLGRDSAGADPGAAA
ncbi:MAG TPA: hypothetical protein VNO20_09490 [Solirubrobacterales bacterium]|nr:hypothetical protein [Solirubrobacterales bacterium]